MSDCDFAIRPDGQPEPVKVRSVTELFRAHDIMDAIANGDIRLAEREQANKIIESCQALRDVLCWMLHHEAGDEFGRFLEHVRTIVKAAGYEERRIV